jgi:hypothetical protein
MRTALIIPIAAMLACGFLTGAAAQQPAADHVVAAKDLTREQFKALSPGQVIDFGSERITKGEYLDRIKQAIANVQKNLPQLRQKLLAAVAARHKDVTDRENADLTAANSKVQAEIARLSAADTQAHGANWDSRRQQAAAILDQAQRATPEERSALEKQAADLLVPAGK